MLLEVIFMDNRRIKKRNRRIMIVSIVIIIILSLFSFFVKRNRSSIEEFLSTSVQTVEYYIFKKPLAFISDIFSEYHECYMRILHKCKWKTEKIRAI